MRMKNTEGFPLFVKLGLLGIHSRKAALVQFWISIALSISILFVVPFITESFFWTVIFCAFVLVTAKWYWSSIRWVDTNSHWEGSSVHVRPARGTTGEKEGSHSTG